MNDRQLRDLAVLADWDENYEDTPAYKPQAKFEAPKPRKPSPTPPRREEPVKLSPPRNTIGAKPEIPPPTTSSNEMDLMSGITQGATKKVDVFGFDIAEPEQPTGETDLFGLAPLKPAANPSANPYATAPQAFIPPATSVNPFENPQMQPMNPAMQQQIAANQMMYNQFMTNMMMQQGMMTNPQNMNFQPPK